MGKIKCKELRFNSGHVKDTVKGDFLVRIVLENHQATVINFIKIWLWVRPLKSMSQVILGAFNCLDCFLEKTCYFICNGAGAEDNSSMLCDLLWNVEISLYCFLSECIKCL